MTTTARPIWATETVPTHPDDAEQALGPIATAGNMKLQLDWFSDDGPGITIEDKTPGLSGFGARISPTEAQELARALTYLISVKKLWEA